MQGLYEVRAVFRIRIYFLAEDGKFFYPKIVLEWKAWALHQQLWSKKQNDTERFDKNIFVKGYLLLLETEGTWAEWIIHKNGINCPKEINLWIRR